MKWFENMMDSIGSKLENIENIIIPFGFLCLILAVLFVIIKSLVLQFVA